MAFIFYKEAQPSNQATNAARIYYDSSLNKVCAIDQSGNVARIGGFATRDYRLIARTFITTASGTFTRTTGSLAGWVAGVGGGGSGGGAASSTGGTNNSIAGGGGGGSWAAKWLTNAAANWTDAAYVCGAGGVAATAGNNAGNNGNNSTWASTTIVANLGSAGGAGGASATALGLRGTGGAGGTAGTGDELIPGEDGYPGMCFSVVAATGMYSGKGGNAGGGCGMGSPALVVSGASAVGKNYGGGSAGSCDAATTNRASGAGGPGAWEVWEFA